jgi:hypothetical protein
VKFCSWALTKPAPRTTAASKLFIFYDMEIKLRVLLEMELIQKKRSRSGGQGEGLIEHGMRGELGEIKVEHEVEDRHLCHTPHERVDEDADRVRAVPMGRIWISTGDAEEKSRKMLRTPCLINHVV